MGTPRSIRRRRPYDSRDRRPDRWHWLRHGLAEAVSKATHLCRRLPRWIWLASVFTVGSLAACSSLMHDSEEECDPQGKCRQTYLSRSVSGRAVTPEDSIGVFALATVSARGHGTLQLTFYRLREGTEEYRVRNVALIGSRTMTEGRELQFDASGVAATVRGEFDYGAYFPAIPVDVQFGSSAHAYTCRMRLEFSRTYSFEDSVRGEPQIPRTVADFLARPPPTRNPAYTPDPATGKYGCSLDVPAVGGA